MDTTTVNIITKKQAERIFDTEMPTRDFWFVSPETDNFSILQDVLNILYNMRDGNDYTARYSKGQHYTRLCINCEVCRKELTSFDPFVMHDRGKPHKKAQQTMLSQGKSVQNMAEDLVFRDLFVPSESFPEGSLENRLDHTTVAVVGVQLLYKERVRDDELYTCQLCVSDKTYKRMSQDQTFVHVTSDSHTFKYMNVAYGCSRSISLTDMKGRVRQVVEREGRVNCLIPLLGADSDAGNSRPHPVMESDSKSDLPFSISSKSSSSSSSPVPKRLKPSPDPPPPPPPPETRTKAIQTHFEAQSIAHFVDQLRNCVEEEVTMKSLMKELRPGHRRVFTNLIKMLGTRLVGFFSYNNNNEEFERMAQNFSEMTMKL